MFEPVPLLFDSSAGRGRFARAAAISGAVHLLLVILLASSGPLYLAVPARPDREYLRQSATPLFAPPRPLTQRDPNQAKISREFNLESLRAPRSRVEMPSPGSVQSVPGRTPKFTAPTARRAPLPGIAVPEAPAIDTAQLRSPSAPPPGLGANTTIVPPRIEAEEKAKLTFEKPGTEIPNPAGAGRIPMPRQGLDETLRGMARSGGGKQIVGDEEEANPGGSPMPGLRPSPAQGKLGSSLELLSDPQGVDFKPYLIRVLSAVRRNWYAVIPESARLGRTGRVAIQFAINREGAVPKLVIAVPSGAEALDRAAVAGISASNPFPPLPADFKGGQIRLQLVFVYNVAR